MTTETSGNQPPEPSRDRPRKYYPPGVYERLVALSRQSFPSESAEFRQWGREKREAQRQADDYLRGLARIKSVPAPPDQRVRISAEVDDGWNPQTIVEADTVFNQEEVDAITEGLAAYQALTQLGFSGARIERSFVLATAGAELVQSNPSNPLAHFSDREEAVWRMFVAARAAEAGYLDWIDKPRDANEGSDEFLKTLMNLPDKLIVHPASSEEPE